MNIQQIFEHSVDLDLLPESPIVLDAGASDLPWTRALLGLRPGAHVVAIEPNSDFAEPKINAQAKGALVMMGGALVGDGRKVVNYAKFSVPIRNYITVHDSEVFRNESARMSTVPAWDIPTVMLLNRIPRFDLVKLDIEGAEFQVLENWPGPIATQITVEFHDFKDRKRWDARYFEKLLKSLSEKGYGAVQHALTNFGSEESNGHWDSLFVLREEFR